MNGGPDRIGAKADFRDRAYCSAEKQTIAGIGMQISKAKALKGSSLLHI